MTTFLLRLLPVFVAAILAAGTWWLAENLRRTETPPVVNSPSRPDYVIGGLRAARLSPEGRVETLLLAERAEHLPDSDTLRLSLPRVQQAGEATVRIEAEQGLSIRQGEEIRLERAVRVTRDAAAGRAAMRLDTEQLTVRPDDDTASSDSAVTIRQGDSTLSGVGMDADNSFRTLKVHSDMRAVFGPKRGAASSSPRT
ncbi:LPS export ABC transporter periplasmic protein LptC [Derxia gummosa]|uniref:LPS export ABC transporter periplasmic protein LptC n=1 Tax=Derxia gummosa DSM 723 TaxID=1121388 RepID=A0A8B6X0Q2_9BURK|nr:LPS export ABC transporter periplasmic protein LptC [Derxia gummosa]